jgi:heme-degrading monooxygenase HmoA
MAFVSLTRLRIRSVRFMPMFAFHALRSTSQVKTSPGCRAVALLPGRSRTFWTMTAWDERESMRRYMISGAHASAMPHLMHWCDEASVAHWEQEDSTLPPWEEADRRMRQTGRASKVNHPSADHVALTYRAPRTSGGARF